MQFPDTFYADTVRHLETVRGLHGQSPDATSDAELFPAFDEAV